MPPFVLRDRNRLGGKLSGLVLLLLAVPAAQASSFFFTVGSASGNPGTDVSVDVNFTPGATPVAGLQFDLVVPPALTFGTVTDGSAATAAGKSNASNVISPSTLRDLVFGLNSNTIDNAGVVTRITLHIAPGTPNGSLPIVIQNVLGATPDGQAVLPDPCVNGTVTVIGAAPPRPAITSPSTASSDVGNFFSYSITATNGPTSYNAAGLPPGLTVNTLTGMISGTPTTPGNYSMTLSATNAGGTGTLVLTLAILNSPTPPAVQIAAGGGSANSNAEMPVLFAPGTLPVSSIQFALGLPSGWSLASARTGDQAPFANVSYNPLAAQVAISNGVTPFVFGIAAYVTIHIAAGAANGTYPINYTAFALTGPAGGSVVGAPTNSTITVFTPIPVITSPAAATGDVGVAFSYAMTATNSPASFSAAGLPPGLSINTATGLISGTPSAAGVFNVTLGAANIGGTGTATLTLTVRTSAAITLTKSAAPTTVKSGDTVTFTIQYQNTSNGDASSVVIADVIPAGSTLVPASITGGGTLAGNTITWNLGVVAGNTSGSVSFQGRVN